MCYNKFYGDMMTEKDYRRILKDKEIKYRATLNLPKEVTFGIEIEYENVLNELISELLYSEEIYNNNFLNWINKPEIDLFYSYLDDDKLMGGEVISPILKDNIKTWENLRTALNILKDNDAIITNQCGGHVNIGAHLLGHNITYWRNFMLLWILYEKEIYRFSSGEFSKVRVREDGVFDRISPLLKENLFLISKLEGKKNIYNYLTRIGMPIVEKTYDISLNNFSSAKYEDGNRIEFRIPNGTLKEEIWQNNINFFAKFLLACRKELDIDHVIYKINHNEHSAIELADYVFEDNIDKDNFLIQTLKTNRIYKKELVPHIEKY